jgi:hypothetical protein
MYELKSYLLFNSLNQENTVTLVPQGDSSNKLIMPNSFNLELYEET